MAAMPEVIRPGIRHTDRFSRSIFSRGGPRGHHGNGCAKMKKTVLLLETALDKNPVSSRTQIDFMREFFRNYDVNLAARQIHSRDDLEFFLNWAKTRPYVKIVHFVGHGSGSPGEARLRLTNGKSIDLSRKRDRDLFSALRSKIILLSCCNVGRDEQIIQRLAKTSGATAIFSYTEEVNDQQCFLIEAMFYHIYLTAPIVRSTSKTVLQKVYCPLREAIRKVFPNSSESFVMDPWPES